MPKISVDQNICIGCGLCASACSECFEIKDGKSHVIAEVCPVGHDLSEIALDCPVQAIIIVEE